MRQNINQLTLEWMINMAPEKTAMSIASQKKEFKFKWNLKLDWRSFLCWFFGIIFSFVPMVIKYFDNYINNQQPNFYLTLFGNVEVFFICVSISITVLFYIIIERQQANPDEKSANILLYILFGILLLITIICIGIYAKQGTNEVEYLSNIYNDISNNIPQEQLLSNVKTKMEDAAAKSIIIANTATSFLSSACIVGFLSFIKRR